jgi:RNA polymerase sigma factor (sigma-70 family)
MSNTNSTSIPSSPSSKDLLDAFVLERIDFYARKVAKRLGVKGEDLDDIRQDMTLEVLKAARRFDSDQATWHTFVCRVLTKHARHYRRDERVRRRHETLSPMDEVEPDGSTDLLDPEAIMDEHDDIGDVDLRLDTETVLASLPPRLRKVCELIRAGKTPDEVAAAVGVHRCHLYRLLDAARRHFEAAGLSFSDSGATNYLLPQM